MTFGLMLQAPAPESRDPQPHTEKILERQLEVRNAAVFVHDVSDGLPEEEVFLVKLPVWLAQSLIKGQT